MLRALSIAFVAVLGLLPSEARAFGRNKVQYDTFDWRVLVTEHLEIHFYPETEALARRAAEYGEDACRRLDSELGHELSKKIPLIVYGSHYHFRQNNVTPGLVGESTGGFTEIFRNRVALPYSGSEEDFRHVIRHELVHAYVFDKLYGGPIKSFFVLQYAFYLPLWFAEGIAEYYANSWDSEAEMMLRDAAVSGALPPFDRVHGGYFVYKSGWSAVAYLVDRHGEGVLREILESLGETRDLRQSIRDVTGEDLGEIATDWLEDVRRRQWPTFAELGAPDGVGGMLTRRQAEGGRMNADGVLSPDGARVVFLSDRSGTADLWVQDTEGGLPPKPLVRGGRGGKFESLHPLRSSVGWSADGRWIVAAAQKESRDALHVIDAATGRSAFEIVPDLDTVERPDWSPADARFVFTGMKNGQVDLWGVDADGTSLERLTNDLAREEGARFHPDGRKVVYARATLGESGRDLWTLDLATGESARLHAAPGDQWDPCWSADGEFVLHVSDELGTRDLMALDVRRGEARRLTALVGGAGAPSVAGDRLVFTAYHEGGFDLVLVEDWTSLPDAQAAPVEIPEVPWRGHTPHIPDEDAETEEVDSETALEAEPGARTEPAPPRVIAYRPRFRSEWISGAFLYDGLGASAAISATISDVLGNHRFRIGGNLFRRVENTDAVVTYSYLARRLDLSLGAFHVKDNLLDDRTTLGQPIGEEGEDTRFSERRWGVLAGVTYPFHTFRRVGLEVTAMELRRTTAGEGAAAEFRGQVLLPRLHHAFDNTLWGWTGPVQGSRWVASVQHSVPVRGDRLSFGTALLDVRRYWRFDDVYVLALRGSWASSFGRHPQEFQLGGPNTIRGHTRQRFRGRNAALLSAEFRYPFVERIQLGWPFRAGFGGVRGDLFLDVGAAFDHPAEFRGWGETAQGRPGLQDVHAGFGVGARARIVYLPLRVDIGWPTDLATVGSPVWHVTVAPEF